MLCKECGKNEIHVMVYELCNACYLRARKKGLIKAHEKKKRLRRVQCKTIGCDGTVSIRGKGYCLKCSRKISRKAMSWNTRKKYHLKENYGITPEEFNAMLVIQNEVCAICGRPEKTIDYRTQQIHTLAVDHNKETGQIRGLLCSQCNTGLGKFEHNKDLLTRAVEYLKEYETETLVEGA